MKVEYTVTADSLEEIKHICDLIEGLPPKVPHNPARSPVACCQNCMFAERYNSVCMTCLKTTQEFANWHKCVSWQPKTQ